MNAMKGPQKASKGYRLLTGLVGGSIIYVVTRLALLGLPEDGSSLVRGVLDIGGMLLGALAPIHSLMEDLTLSGAMPEIK